MKAGLVDKMVDLLSFRFPTELWESEWDLSSVHAPLKASPPELMAIPVRVSTYSLVDYLKTFRRS